MSLDSLRGRCRAPGLEDTAATAQLLLKEEINNRDEDISTSTETNVDNLLTINTANRIMTKVIFHIAALTMMNTLFMLIMATTMIA